MAKYDLLLKNGQVIDPAQDICGPVDVAVSKGCIARVSSNIPDREAATTIKVDGAIICPGLIDLHLHGLPDLGNIGCDLDQICPCSGVTTAVDLGSAGWINIAAARRIIAAYRRTRTFLFIHPSSIGLSYIPGLSVVEDIKATCQRKSDQEIICERLSQELAKTIRRNADIVKGLKVRKGLLSDGLNCLRVAVKAAQSEGLPVAVHLGPAGVCPDEISLQELFDFLKRGDIITHCFTVDRNGFPVILDSSGKILDSVRKAQNDGIIFDVGHGGPGPSFSFTVARKAIEQGFLPNTISSDLGGSNVPPETGPIKDLSRTMTKFLNLGMDIKQVISACTAAPAAAIGLSELGTLRTGTVADIAVLQLRKKSIVLNDSGAGVLHTSEVLEPLMTIARGLVVYSSPSAHG